MPLVMISLDMRKLQIALKTNVVATDVAAAVFAAAKGVVEAQIQSYEQISLELKLNEGVAPIHVKIQVKNSTQWPTSHQRLQEIREAIEASIKKGLATLHPSSPECAVLVGISLNLEAPVS